MGRGLRLWWASIRAGGQLEGCSAKKWWGGCTSWAVASCVVRLRKSTSICDLRVKSPQLKVSTPTMLYTRTDTQCIHNREGKWRMLPSVIGSHWGARDVEGDGCVEGKYLNKGWDGMEGWEGRVPQARMCGHWGLVFLTLPIMAGWNHRIFVIASELRIIHKALYSIYAEHTAVVLLTDILMLINTQWIYQHCEHTDDIVSCVQIPFPKLCAADLINSRWSLEEGNAASLCTNNWSSKEQRSH